MNHRELVLSAGKKAKFLFLSLPEELQDEVIDGLDGQKLTIEAARDLIRSRGHTIGHDAISGYYRAVRRERRVQDARQELSRIIAEFGEKPLEDGLQSLANLIIAMAAAGLADGSVGIKDIDLGKVLQAMGKRSEGTGVRREELGVKGEAEAEGRRVIDAATIKDLRTQLGL